MCGVLYDLNDLLIFLTTVRYNNKNLGHDFIRVLSYGILQSCSFTFVMPIFFVKKIIKIIFERIVHKDY